jgi:hypothetical protein
MTNGTCHTPGCPQEGGEGIWGLFCEPCATFLAGVALRLSHDRPGARRPGSVRPRPQPFGHLADDVAGRRPSGQRVA